MTIKTLNQRNLILLIALAGITFLIIFKSVITAFILEIFDNIVYALIILGVFSGLIWLRRERVQKAKYQPAVIPALILFLSGIGLLMMQKFCPITGCQYLAFLLSLGGLALLGLGKQLLRVISLPILYIIFIYFIFHFEFLDRLSDNFHLNFQIITAFFSYIILKVLGVMVFQDWATLLLPHITLVVDKSCSGVNHVVALLLLAIPLAESGRKTRSQKALLFFYGIFIAIFMNGLRVALIGIWSYAVPQVSLHGPQNILYVPFVFVLGSFLMIIISSRMDRKKEARWSKGSRETDNGQGIMDSRPVGTDSS
jgi:exosortase